MAILDEQARTQINLHTTIYHTQSYAQEKEREKQEVAQEKQAYMKTPLTTSHEPAQTPQEQGRVNAHDIAHAHWVEEVHRFTTHTHTIITH
jgi:hypothetical protein